jgi:hypothetical protein
MKVNKVLVAAMAVFLMSTSAFAITAKSVKWQMDTMMTWQNLNQYANNTMYKIQPGFQSTLANLRMDAALNDGIDVVAEWYLSSRPHVAAVYDNQGYVFLKQFPKDSAFAFMNGALNFFSIKAGHFEVDYGMNGEYSSNNAERRKNPLVGNFLVNPSSVEAGMEISSKPGFINWNVGLGSGITNELFDSNRATSKHGKVMINTGVVKAAFSGYFADNSGYSQTATKPTTELYLSNRNGTRYAAVINGLTGTWNGNPVLGAGGNVSAYQFDLSAKVGAFDLYGNTGRMLDSDTNAFAAGTPVEEWVYYGAQVVYQLNKDVFFAYRYGQADSNQLATTSYTSLGGAVSITRSQVGVGIYMMPDLLWKTEYVQQGYHNMIVNNTVAVAGNWNNPNFDGFVTEVTMPLNF